MLRFERHGVVVKFWDLGFSRIRLSRSSLSFFFQGSAQNQEGTLNFNPQTTLNPKHSTKSLLAMELQAWDAKVRA